MQADEQQFDRVARWLDGEDVALSDDERALAQAVRRDAAALGGALEVHVPPRATARARRRMTAELARPRRRALRVALGAGAVAAAAAAVVVAVALTGDSTPPTRAGDDLATIEVPVEVLAPRADEDLELLGEQMDELAAEMAAAPPAEVDLEIEAIEQEVEDLLLEDPWAGSPEG